MKILVTFALGSEFAPWRKLRGFKRVGVDSWEKTFVAKVGEADVRVILTGVGRFAAQRAMGQAFSVTPDICIASGLSGALKKDYVPGQILAAKTVANMTGTRMLQTDAGLVAAAAASGAKVVANFLVSESVISTAQEKQRLGASGDAVDMESLYVLAVAEQRSVRAVAIRAISDGVNDDLPLDFERVFNDQGGVSIGKVLRQIAAKPARIPGLMRLASNSERAAGALAIFLDAYIQSLFSRPLDDIAKAAALAVN